MTTGPTVRRRRLGTELRRLRDSNGLKLEEVAAQLGVAPSTLSRIETGKAPTKSAYLNQMLEMYGVSDHEQRQVLVDMAREGHRKGWWAAYDDVLPSGFDIYVGLEAETAAVRGYEISVVHGLLQIPDYARAVLREMFPRHAAEQIDRLVDLRIERQRRLDDDPPLELWAILDEAVIRRPVGGTKVMCAQLEHLLAMAERPGPDGAGAARSRAARTRGTAGRSRSSSSRTGPTPRSPTSSPWPASSTWRRTGRSGSGPRPSTGSGPRRWRPARPPT